MFFGATSFSATTFAGVGIQHVVVLPNGNRLNITIGYTRVGFGPTVTGNSINLACGGVSVISWHSLIPNATEARVSLDSLKPTEDYVIKLSD